MTEPNLSTSAVLRVRAATRCWVLALGWVALVCAAPTALALEPDRLVGSVALAGLFPGALQRPVYWSGTSKPVGQDYAIGLRARASLSRLGVGLRADLNSVPDGRAYGRLLAEAHSAYVMGGVGLGVLPGIGSNWAVRLPMWLQVGTPALHVRARVRDGGPTVDPRDAFAIAVGTQQAVLSSRMSAELGWGTTVVGSGPELTLAAGYSHWVGLLQVRQLGETDQGTRVWQVGVALQMSMTAEIPGTAVPEMDEVAAVEVGPVAETMDQVLQPGTLLKLVTKRNARGAESQTALCLADEATQAGDETWYHLTCSPELPSNSPPAWRTGCYVVRQEGIWRMPACPGEARPSGVRAELIVPANLSEVSNKFIDLGALASQPRTFRIDGATVEAACVVRATERVTETCYAANLGLVWSAWYWPARNGGNGEARAVKLVGVARDMPIDDSAPHLRGLQDNSAKCLFGASCAMFGQCSVVHEECQARSRADCTQSAVCARWGRCTPKRGACVAATSDDCVKSLDCQENGACSVDGDRCVARGPDCVATPACRLLGRCTAVAGRCRLVSDADCRTSQQCQRDGQCHLRGGICWANDDADCAASEGCTAFGQCRAQDGRCTSDSDEAP